MQIEEKKKEALKMKRVWKIYKDELYQFSLAKIEECEKTRIYCVHDFAHFLDVARLGYILSLERSLSLDKELIYATALLHDIGRWKEYTDGLSHDLAGAALAEEILDRCDFAEEEIFVIKTAISSHRGDKVCKAATTVSSRESDKTSSAISQELSSVNINQEPEVKNLYETIEQLQEVLYDADKLSRNCYRCKSQEGCKWSQEKKNLSILW